jgi:hypothetical protein
MTRSHLPRPVTTAVGRGIPHRAIETIIVDVPKR